MPALRYNEGKPELHRLLQFGSALEKLARVMSQGSIKYADGNWLLGEKPDKEYLDSAMRHISAFVGGQEYDPDIGVHHLASAVWNLLALLRLNRDGAPDLSPSFDQAAFAERWAKAAQLPPSSAPDNMIEVGQRRRVSGQETLAYTVIGPKALMQTRPLWIVRMDDGPRLFTWAAEDILKDPLA